ncbi:hypothetical protein Kisp02_40920 [Kineosporia sp. NBRC 101731]|nr:hypothetical protein Kisp02_40920 [Kineosporia sp. NBRC 101731]
MPALALPEIALPRPASLTGLVTAPGGKARAGTVAEAAEADLVFLSVPWSRIPAAVAQVPDWSSRIVVDTTNPSRRPHPKVEDRPGCTPHLKGSVETVNGASERMFMAGLAPLYARPVPDQ